MVAKEAIPKKAVNDKAARQIADKEAVAKAAADELEAVRAAAVQLDYAKAESDRQIADKEAAVKAAADELKAAKSAAASGNTPGGNTPGGNTPGGNTPGGNTPHQNFQMSLGGTLLFIGLMMLLAGIFFIVLVIETTHPELNDVINAALLSITTGFIYIIGAIFSLFGILAIIGGILYYTGNENITRTIFYIIGSLLNMIAAGLFAFAIEKISTEISISIVFIVISVIFASMGTLMILKFTPLS